MKIELIKPMSARKIHLAVLAAGSIIDIPEHAALPLIGKFAEVVGEVKKAEPVEPSEEIPNSKGKKK